jgi:carbamoyl-phosphate synthase large subunit
MRTKDNYGSILVTGVGAIIGYGVLRSLNEIRNTENGEFRIVGADINSDAVGQRWCDSFLHAPFTSAPDYPSWLREQIERYEIRLVIPGIEQDVDALIDNPEMLDGLDCVAAVNRAELVRLGRDKLLMDRELLRIGESCRIETSTRGNLDHLAKELGMPFIVKPRRGYASKGIAVIDDEVSFGRYAEQIGVTYIAQRIVGTDDNEYSVSIFGDGGGDSWAVSCLRRRLALDGSTAKAENVTPNSVADLSQTLDRLVRHFKPLGPTNFQFRVEDKSCKLLEINPRISSSTSIRSLFGHNESKMCIDFFMYGRIPSQPKFRPGRVVRYIEDMVSFDSNN